MDTNTVSQIAQAANDAGVKLTGAQITAIIAGGAAAARWLRSETKLAIETWAGIGGWAGIKAFFKTGNPAPLSPAIQTAGGNSKATAAQPVVAASSISTPTP